MILTGKIYDTILDYIQWIFEYSLLLLLWGKIKKKTLSLTEGQYTIKYTRIRVKLHTYYIRVPMYDIEGVYIIYPFKLKYEVPLKVLFFNFKSNLNKT